ncbi:nitroreductase [Microbaculum marinum]|uniref:Putative NAD(P)H nitroreductase n=1 Tax=Microbaculum marinum TaxID=1764581 RepID=A0AAW9RUL5_9HYPH
MTQTSTELMTYLSARRSIPAARLIEPAPSGAELERILTVAARVPDHGKLAPWRFIVLAGADRNAFVDRLMEIWRTNNPDASEEAGRIERGKRDGGPLLVVVVSRAGEHPKIPVWEQELSAGAACMNFIHATNALGYAAQWLTGWPAYDRDVAAVLGMEEGERIAGYMHVGTPDEGPIERDRPDLADIVSHWRG